MRTLNIRTLLGLDLRQGERKPGACDVATNVVIDDRGSAVRRPGLVKRVNLPAGTAGWYTVDDVLRVCCPNGTSTTGLFPTLLLDYLDLPSVSGRVMATRLASGRRALWVERDGGQSNLPTIHLTEVDPATTATASRVTLPFAPRGLLGLNARLFSLDPSGNRLRWSGTDDPTVNGGKGYVGDWSEALDIDEEAQKGGFQSLYSAGSQAVALSEYRNRVAVLSRSSIQAWALDDGGVAALDQTIAGPGCQHLGTIGVMSGDLLYADAGGVVRRLSSDVQTDIAREQGTIGEAVAAITKLIAAPGATPYGLYARALGAYLLGSGTSMVCLSMVAGSLRGWSRWELPVSIDGLTECRGTVYLRSGNVGYSFEDNAPDDEVDTTNHVPIPTTIRPAPVQGEDLLTLGEIAAAVSAGNCTLRAVIDGVATATAPIIARGPRFSRRTLTRQGRSVSLELACAAAPAGWRCDGFQMSVQE